MNVCTPSKGRHRGRNSGVSGDSRHLAVGNKWLCYNYTNKQWIYKNFIPLKMFKYLLLACRQNSKYLYSSLGKLPHVSIHSLIFTAHSSLMLSIFLSYYNITSIHGNTKSSFLGFGHKLVGGLCISRRCRKLNLLSLHHLRPPTSTMPHQNQP
jgi:hypothetical protein